MILESVGLLGERSSVRLDQHCETLTALGARWFRSDELRQAPDDSLAIKVGERHNGEVLATTAVVVLTDRVLAAVTEPDILGAHRAGQRVLLDIPEQSRLRYGRGWLRTLRAADAVITDTQVGLKRLRLISSKINIVNVPSVIDPASEGLRKTWTRLVAVA